MMTLKPRGIDALLRAADEDETGGDDDADKREKDAPRMLP